MTSELDPSDKAVTWFFILDKCLIPRTIEYLNGHNLISNKRVDVRPYIRFLMRRRQLREIVANGETRYQTVCDTNLKSIPDNKLMLHLERRVPERKKKRSDSFIAQEKMKQIPRLPNDFAAEGIKGPYVIKPIAVEASGVSAPLQASATAVEVWNRANVQGQRSLLEALFKEKRNLTKDEASNIYARWPQWLTDLKGGKKKNIAEYLRKNNSTELNECGKAVLEALQKISSRS